MKRRKELALELFDGDEIKAEKLLYLLGLSQEESEVQEEVTGYAEDQPCIWYVGGECWCLMPDSKLPCQRPCPYGEFVLK